MAYHLSPNGPRPCGAKKDRCPYALAGEPHFDTVKEASVAYEAKMQETFGAFDKLKKSYGQVLREDFYHDVDNWKEIGRTVLASKPVVNTVKAINYVRDAPKRVKESVARTKANVWRGLSAARNYTEDRLVSVNNWMDRQEAKLLSLVKSAPQRMVDQTRNIQVAFNKANQGFLQDIESGRFRKPKLVEPGKVKVGDKFSENLMVTSVVENSNNTLTFQTRDVKTGRFGSSRTVANTDRVQLGVLRTPARYERYLAFAKRPAGSGPIARMKVFYNDRKARTRGWIEMEAARVKMAADLQKQSWQALSGVHSTTGRVNMRNVSRTNDLSSIHAMKKNVRFDSDKALNIKV